MMSALALRGSGPGSFLQIALGRQVLDEQLLDERRQRYTIVPRRLLGGLSDRVRACG